MRIIFRVSTVGSALALKLAKSGSEAMIAVDPKGETSWHCRRRRLDRRGSRDIPARLKISRAIYVLRSSPAVSAPAAIPPALQGSGPRRWFCSFLTHRQKRKPKIRKTPPEKGREPSS